jgi:hypothetical protein
MAVEKTITKEARDNAIDLIVTLAVIELSEDLKIDPDEIFFMFVSSKTGELLYDNESDLWCYGPAYIEEMFKNEMR